MELAEYGPYGLVCGLVVAHDNMEFRRSGIL